MKFMMTKRGKSLLKNFPCKKFMLEKGTLKINFMKAKKNLEEDIKFILKLRHFPHQFRSVNLPTINFTIIFIHKKSFAKKKAVKNIKRDIEIPKECLRKFY